MRTLHPNFVTTVLLATTMLFASCSKDNLVIESFQDVAIGAIPSQLEGSSPLSFTLWQDIKVQQPECPFRTGLHTIDNTINSRSSNAGCVGDYHMSSNQGQGWNRSHGRFLSKVNLNFNTQKRLVHGIVEIQFSTGDDVLILETIGTYGMSSTNGSETITVDVVFKEGTRRFTDLDFAGKLVIQDSEQIFNGSTTNFNATITIQENKKN